MILAVHAAIHWAYKYTRMPNNYQSDKDNNSKANNVSSKQIKGCYHALNYVSLFRSFATNEKKQKQEFCRMYVYFIHKNTWYEVISNTRFQSGPI